MKHQKVYQHRLALHHCTFIGPVVDPIDDGAFEDHLVLSESTRFITKDVFNLTEVLGNVEGVHFDTPISHGVIEADIVVHEEDLEELHAFNSYVQGEGYHSLEGKKGEEKT